MSHLLQSLTLRRTVLGGVLAAAALAPAAAHAAYFPGIPGQVGTQAKYIVHESTYDAVIGESPGDTTFTKSDSVKSEAGSAVAHSPGWPLIPAAFPPPMTACTGGCADADAVGAARADATGTLETYARSHGFGWGGHEALGDARTTARIDDTITVSKATSVVLRGSVVAKLMRRSTDPLRMQEPDSDLEATLRFGSCGSEGCDPSMGWSESFSPPLITGESASNTVVNRDFSVEVALPEGKSPFSAVLAADAQSVGEENGSSTSRVDTHRNDDGDKLTFEIVVPDDVVVTSGSGKLPIVGGKSEQQDTTPPAIQVPAGLTVDATSPAGRSVTYAVQATDASGTPTLSCAPASDSTFAIGTTTVTCVATDAAGNSATKSFTVTVRGVADQLAALRARIVQIGGQVQTSLLPHLKEKCNSMGSLRHAIGNLVRRGELSQVVADELLISVDRIAGALGC